jgi:microcin C transport system substrate-binding protein
MKNLALLLALVTGLASTSVHAATSSYDSLPAVKKGGNLNETIALTPSTLNPLLTTDVEAQDLASYFYLPLFGVDGATYDYYPSLASKLEVSKDKKDYTYTLNSAAKWADGTAVTTDDVAYTFERLMDPKVEAAPIRGYYEGVTFQKIDNLKFKFHVNDPRFNTIETLQGFVTLQKKQFAKEADFNKTRENLHPVGTGPFKIKTFSRDQAIVFERDANWWAKDLPQFKARFNQDTWTFKVIPDMALKYEKFLKGEVDVMNFGSDQYVNQVIASDKDKVGKSPKDGKVVWAGKIPTDGSMGWSGIALNFKSPLFATKDTRKGLAYLVDYKTIIERAYFGMIEQSVSPFGSNTDNTDPGLKAKKGIYTYDTKKAAEYFAKDGWKKVEGQPFLMKMINGKNTPFHFALKYYASNPAGAKMAVIMKESMKKSGVDLELKPMDGTALYKDFEDREFDAAMMGWGGGSIYPDPKQIWSSESIGQGSNKVSFSNPKVDELIKKANAEFDRKKRAKFLQEINRILYDEVPYIFTVERHFLLQGINSRFQSPKWVERYGSGPARELFHE